MLRSYSPPTAIPNPDPVPLLGRRPAPRNSLDQRTDRRLAHRRRRRVRGDRPDQRRVARQHPAPHRPPPGRGRGRLLATNPLWRVAIGRERLRQILRHHDVSFHRTRAWKESCDPDKDAKLDRIEEVTCQFPHRRFAFGQFGPLSIRPQRGCSWRPRASPTGCRRPTPAPMATVTTPDRAQVDPCRPPGRCLDLCDSGQSGGEQAPQIRARGRPATRSSSASPPPKRPVTFGVAFRDGVLRDSDHACLVRGCVLPGFGLLDQPGTPLGAHPGPVDQRVEGAVG